MPSHHRIYGSLNALASMYPGALRFCIYVMNSTVDPFPEYRVFRPYHSGPAYRINANLSIYYIHDSKMNVTIRAGRKDDLSKVHALVKELAEYERDPGAVTATLAEYRTDFQEGFFDFLIAEVEGEIVGMAIYYTTYSTWKGRMLYLEDFYVQPDFRRHGIGRRLFDAFLEIARKKDCKIVKWQVLDWNEPALSFYKKIGAEIEKNWYNGKLYLDQDER